MAVNGGSWILISMTPTRSTLVVLEEITVKQGNFGYDIEHWPYGETPWLIYKKTKCKPPVRAGPAAEPSPRDKRGPLHHSPGLPAQTRTG